MLTVRKIGFVLAIAILPAIAPSAQADLLLSHYGSADPATEWWTPVITGNGVSVGAAPNDLGTGIDAWRTTDADISTSPKASAYYSGESVLTQQDLDFLATNSWSMRATLRVDDFIARTFDETPALAPGFQVAFEQSATWLVLALGSDANGDTTMLLKGGSNLSTPIAHTISGSGYNDYELIWNSTEGLDVLVNDTLVIDNQPCTTTIPETVGNRIYWGASDTPGVGAGYWNKVEFESIEYTAPPTPPFEGLYHSADTDPETEGWTPVINGNNVSVGPVLNDGNPGAHAWQTTDADTSTDPKASAYYKGEAELKAQHLTDLAENGWSMQATLRVDDFIVSGFDETPGLTPGIQLAFEDPGLWVLFSLGSDSGGDTTMILKGNYNGGVWGESIEHTISGSGYNDYELVWDPTDGLDLFVNDELIVDNYDCSTDFGGALGNRIYWGCTDTGGMGSGFWSNIAFEINYQEDIPGDANRDGSVDVSDLGILATNYGAAGTFGWEDGDFTGDGAVDVSDLGILATNYGTVPTSQAVPEPSSIAIFVFGLAAWATFVRRRRRG